MSSLICDLHLWSLREDLTVRDTDFSCFKYYDKANQKAVLDKPYAQDKLSFAFGRGHTNFLDSKRPAKLRNNFKELEEVLEQQQLVFAEWRSSSFFQIIFSNGLIANIFINAMGDVEKITFDKFLVGRLLEHISKIHFGSKFLLVTYLVSKVTLVTFGKTVVFTSNETDKFKPYEGLAQFDPKVQVLDILGPSGRRLNRHMVVAEEKNLVLFWWSSNGNEVFPWAPHLKEEDRANIMLYSFSHSEPKRIGFTRTHTDPLAIRFLFDGGKIGIHYLGQVKVTILDERFQKLDQHTHYKISKGCKMFQDSSRRGEVQVESVFFGVGDSDRKFRRKSSKKLVHGSEILSHVFVADHLVILGGADGTLLLMDIVQHKLECQTKCCFSPTILRLHPDQAIFAAANEKGMVQCFDIALSPIRLNFAIEDLVVGNVLDLSSYFPTSVVLMDALWCQRNKDPTAKPCPMESLALNYMLLRFQGGPFLLVRVSGGCLSSPSPGSLGALQISSDYLAHNQFQQALLLLNQLDWKSQGQTLILSINSVFHKILRSQMQFTPDKESLLEMCLGLFHAPTKPIPDEVVDEFSEQMHDLSRKFFHQLLRHHRFTKAFRLAVDLNDYDLFMDIHHAANRLKERRQTVPNTGKNDAGIDGLNDLAQAALIKAKIVFFDEDGDKVEDDEEDDNESSSGESGDESRVQDNVDSPLDQSQTGISQLYVSSKPATVMKGLHEVSPKPNDVVPEQVASAPPSSHNQLGIPLVTPAMSANLSPKHLPFHLSSFNARNFQLGPVPQAQAPIVELRMSTPHRLISSASHLPFYGMASTSFVEDSNIVAEPDCENPADSLRVGSDESSLVSFQPELSATFAKVTAAKRIPTNLFQASLTRSEPSLALQAVSSSPSENKPQTPSLPRSISNDQLQEDIQVIHFGVV